ncbi:MAG: SPFH domain-containing protein [Ilumatobacter sp.]|uniref:flotillin family protein n=1 Tax=Ilumatobacter sp. TaxID=1967498 RepID=UPI00262BC541|nr:SPFH domain-containing protein [Ilumatobacter sp.]MDJ0767219.1 SPFH domain-containing protein [Ilumatobacter sp.]
MSPVVVFLIVIAALLVSIVVLIASRFKVAGPNEAFIVTGRKGKAVTNPETGAISTDLSGQKVVMGASTFVLPVVQKLAVLDLSSRQIAISVGSAVSAQGIKCSLEGVAIVKVGGTENAIRASAQRFLGQQNEIEPFTQEVLAGSLRAIVGRLSVEEIIKDRAAFAREVAEEAESSLTNQGLVLDTFQLQDIQTEGNYLKDLGRPEAARAEKEASIAEAEARRQSEEARLKAEEEIAIANRELELRKAEILAETDAAAADAQASGPLAKAAKDQEVIAAQELVAERVAALKERELDTEVRKPADAERYAVEQRAEAEKTKRVREAEAARIASIEAAQAHAEEDRLVGAGERQRREELAKAIELEGQAKGAAERAQRAAAAEALQLEGDAEAAAILARGDAEATAMEKKAEAYEQYGQAAILDLLADMLPELVKEAAAPLSAVDKMTVISTDGASQITKNAAQNVTQGLELASDLLGVDLADMFKNFANQQAGEIAATEIGAATNGDE